MQPQIEQFVDVWLLRVSAVLIHGMRLSDFDQFDIGTCVAVLVFSMCFGSAHDRGTIALHSFAVQSKSNPFDNRFDSDHVQTEQSWR